ncbi:MAG TPA: hypothetical protein VIM70_09465 [Clostridium sp.]|uniref:fibronectin type III domain-containing protein n=1 Tax=Clostridium sp. TaxID=1506 RepID=UPI002F946913
MKKLTTLLITTALTSAVILGTNTLITQSKSKAPIKSNVSIARQKTLLSENTPVPEKELLAKDNVDVLAIKKTTTLALDNAKQAEAIKSAQIAATAGKQEEIDRIAAERPATSKQPAIAKNNVTPQQKTASVQRANLATANTSSLTQDEEDEAAAAAAEAAAAEADRLAQIAAANHAILMRNQTVTTTRLSSYLTPAANVISVLNRAVALHSGDPANNCVYFSSEALRRIGVSVPLATCNTGQYLSYFRAHAWITSSAIKELIPGNICFTTNGWNGYPTHTFVFMGWVTDGDYTWAYVADNQGTSVHVRNMGATTETDAFAYYVHTPTTPQAFAALSSGYNSIYVGWNTVAGVSGYEVSRATSSNGSYTLIATTSATRFNNTGLTTNNAYYYKVRSYKVVGSVKQYSPISNTVSSKPIPSAPSTIRIASSSYNSINTIWLAIAGANGYEVYSATSSDGLYTLMSNTTALSYKDTGLTTNSTYYYKFRSYRMVGSVKIFSVFSNPISSTPIPSPPKSVNATSSSPSSITTSWNTVTGAAGYEVYGALSSNDTYNLLLDTTGNSYNNTGLTTYNNYFYVVRAYTMVDDIKVYSNWSIVVSAHPVPAGPVNLVATRKSSSIIRLTWSPITGASGYEVYKATSSTGTYSLLSSMSSPYQYYTNYNLTTGKTYYYKVRSFLTVGNTRIYGNWSTVVHATT